MKKVENGPLFSPAAQLMTIEAISELLVTTSPHKLGEVLTEHLRKLSGARIVMVLAHRPVPEPDELLQVSPLRLTTLFSQAELNNFCYEVSPGEFPFLTEELPENHPLHVPLLRAGIRSMARYPLRAAGELVGLLLLFDIPGLDCIAETNKIINLLSPPIAMALKISLAFRLFEQQALELEQRVGERTAELREAQALFQIAIDSSPFPIMIHDEDDQVLQLSSGWTNLSGYTLEDIPTFSAWMDKACREKAGTKINKQLFDIDQTIYNGELTVTAKDGSVRIWDFQTTPLGKVSKGKRVLLSMAADITQRKQVEGALRASEERHRTILQTAMDGFWLLDSQGRLLEVNETYCRMSGYSARELLALRIHDLEATESTDDTTARINKIKAQGEDRFEFRHRRKDGSIFDVEVSVQYRPVEGGRFVVFLREISERKRSEDEKIKLEAKLQQAQKMESVGRLAGGVAHDFNNMLSVILGNSYLALMDMDPAQPLYIYLTEIRKAAERSAELTQQLLAFARKQTIAPKVLDLNDTVAGMLKMLQRLIGEGIHLSWQPEANLWPVKVDPSQIDQILANLCVNSRDSIADVGKITIETGNSVIDEAYCAHRTGFIPGEYVRLAVSDDGCGMDKETLAHIFEPFFTTKVVGEGTGLGLATVYGIVKQNNGFINVYSEPGLGTTFTIFLPRLIGKVVQTRADCAAEPAPRGQETILLVEDEPAILNITTMILTSQGYTVLQANTPGEALRLAREYGSEIHLLLTDVVMPEMNGRVLADNLLSFYPQLKCLFMSGYTADVIAHHGVLDEDVHFIQKPFSLPDLTAKVREVMESQ